MKKKLMILAAFLSLNVGLVLTSYANPEEDCVNEGQIIYDDTNYSIYYICTPRLEPLPLQCHGSTWDSYYGIYVPHHYVKGRGCVPFTESGR